MSKEPDLFDQFMADGLLIQGFMVQVCLELSKDETDRVAWTRQFIDELYARLDANEHFAGEAAARYPMHELARARIDKLGSTLAAILARRRS